MKLHAYIFIIVLLLSTSLSTVNAAPPEATKLPSINGAITDYAETKFGGTEAIEIWKGNVFGYSLQDIIMPIYKKAQQISSPDLKPLGIGTMQTYNKYLLSDSFNEKIIHYSDINENIATTIFCAVIRNRSKYGKNALTITKSGVQKSSNFEYSQESIENLRISNALQGLSEVAPNKEGFLDFNLPSMYHPPGTAKCGKQYTSEEDKPVENDVTELASWGGGTGTVDVTNKLETIYNWVIKVIEGVAKLVTDGYKKFYPSYEAVLTESTRPSNNEYYAHAGDATEEDVKNAPDESTKKLSKSRGLAFAYLPEERSTDPNEHAAKTQYSYNIKSLSLEGNDVFDGENGGIEHPWLLINNAKFRACQMARSVVPDGKRYTKNRSIGDGSKGDIVLDEKCPEITPTIPSNKWNCNTNVPEQTVSGLNKEAGQSFADSGIFGEGCTDQKENAWKLCNNDVIARAKKACVDPIFALAIWLHESGASNYICSEQLNNGNKVEDFGIHGLASVPPEDFSAQLDHFLKLNYTCPHTINDFISMYYIGNKCYNDEPDKIKIDGYVAELQVYYSQIGGGTLPSWPTGSCSN